MWLSIHLVFGGIHRRGDGERSFQGNREGFANIGPGAHLPAASPHPLQTLRHSPKFLGHNTKQHTNRLAQKCNSQLLPSPGCLVVAESGRILGLSRCETGWPSRVSFAHLAPEPPFALREGAQRESFTSQELNVKLNWRGRGSGTSRHAPESKFVLVIWKGVGTQKIDWVEPTIAWGAPSPTHRDEGFGRDTGGGGVEKNCCQHLPLLNGFVWMKIQPL